MAPPNKQDQLIQDYLDGLLDEEKRLHLEQRIREDPDFAREVGAYREAYEQAEAFAMLEMKQQVGNWLDEAEKTESAAWWGKPWFRVAAVVLPLFLLAIVWLVLRQQSQLPEHWMAWQKTSEDAGGLGRSSPSIQGIYDQGIIALRDGDFPTAAAQFREIPDTDSLSLHARYHLAKSLLGQEEYAAALTLFEEVEKQVRDQNPLAEGYALKIDRAIALTYLYLDRRDKAIARLKQLIGEEESRYPEEVELLELLQSPAYRMTHF